MIDELEKIASSCKELGVSGVTLLFDDWKKVLDVSFDFKEKYVGQNDGKGTYQLNGVYFEFKSVKK
jgi:hypothetical protein